MGKILPILLAVIGIGAGVGAGLFLKPEAAQEDLAANPCGEVPHDTEMAVKSDDMAKPENVEYVKLTNQFVIPVVIEAKVASMVVLALSVEVETGRSEEVYTREPKLRDAFLQVLFDHANVGGFNGSFTSSGNMKLLRRALMETSRNLFGDLVQDVLITDIARQDV